MKNNQETNTNQLVILSLLNTIKGLKAELESSHIDYIVLGDIHNSEECSRCQAIAEAKTMLAIHKS